MELFTLDSSMQLSYPVENYSSLIWTERYNSAGDFELVTGDISRTINLMPLESCVALRESTVPMVVEAYKITKSLTGAPQITVVGRSFETVLERRAAVHTPFSTELAGVRSSWLVCASKTSDAAYLAMREVLGEFERYQDDRVVLPAVAPSVSANDAIPEIDLVLPADYETPAWSSAIIYRPNDVVQQDDVVYQATALTSPANQNQSPVMSPSYWNVISSGNVATTGTTNLIAVEPKDLYNAVLDLTTVNNRGLKATRPVSGATKVGIEIYNGANLTDTVRFYTTFDQFDAATYLMSYQGSANIAYVYGANGSESVLKNAGAEPTGLNRRVLLVDATSDSTVTSADARRSRGLVELYQANATVMFDGELALQVASGFNRDYFLGDIVRFTGEYAVDQNVRIAEYIRTSDNTGEKAYPAFEAVT